MKNQGIEISITLYIKLLENNAKKAYLIDSGKINEYKDRLSVYLLEGLLTFSIIDRTGEEHIVTVNYAEMIGHFHVLTFELANFQSTSTISIFRDNELLVSKEAFLLIFSNNPFEENYFIGADRSGKNPCDFEIAEQLVYGKVLLKEEKLQIFKYLTEKHDGNPKNSILFTNGAFLYRDKDSNNLIQPNKPFQPQYKNSNVL